MKKLSAKGVIKHSWTIQISNKISLLQRKAWNVLLANAYDDLPTKDRYQVRMKDLMESLQIKTRNTKYLKEVIKDLMSIVVEFNLLSKDGKNKWIAMNLLGDCLIDDGILTYSYGSILRERLYNPDMYARIKLSMQNKFSSKHTLALYELCVDYFIEKKGYGTTPFIELDKFRDLMGVEKNEYPLFKIFNSKIIKKPVDEINDKTDIVVKPEYKKEGRKVVAVKFSIKPNPKNKDNEIPLLFQEIDEQKTNNTGIVVSKPELYERLQKYFCLSPPQAQGVLSTYDEKYILENLAYVEKKNKRGEIKNIGAYTLKTLKEDYRNQKSQFDIEKEEKKQQKEKHQKEREERQRVEYYQYQRMEAKKYQKKLSPQEIQRIEDKITKEVNKSIEDGKNPDFTFSLLVLVETEKYLIEKSDALSFEEWQKTQHIS